MIKVLEHALKKNIDWFTMSKELEAQGIKNGKVTALKGKGKGKRAKGDNDDGEESDSNTARQKPRVKMDGNSLCKSCSCSCPEIRRADNIDIPRFTDELFHYVSVTFSLRLGRHADSSGAELRCPPSTSIQKPYEPRGLSLISILVFRRTSCLPSGRSDCRGTPAIESGLS